MRLARELHEIVATNGGQPCAVGVLRGRPIVGLDFNELLELLAETEQPTGVPKANTSNLGMLLHRGSSAATTVSTTMELAASAGVRVFATGGLGGVHQGYAAHLDVSSDLLALARVPVAVVCAGVKSLLDVAATREALETLGVPVIGVGSDAFPAFYLRELTGSQRPAPCDARIDDPEALADFVRAELRRTGRGIVITKPISREHELNAAQFAGWLKEAEALARASGATARALTPAVLANLHAVSGGKTLEANLALVRSNAALAARIASHLATRVD
jgi:pseudouridylate synthase